MSNGLVDKEYFKRYCDSIDMIFGNSTDEITFIKDADFIFRYVSQGYLDLIHQEDPSVTAESILGQNDFNVESEEESNVSYEDILSQDKMIRDTRTIHRFLHVDTQNKIFIVTKRPMINPATNNFVGIFCSIRNFMHPHLINLIYRINGVSFGLANSQQIEPLKYKLTQRQHMVLFLYVNKYSYTEIASIMTVLGHKISPGRVNDHLENLKYIFAVKTKEQLIETALSYKYHLYIPRQFLKHGSYHLDDEIIISKK